jgi:hypothetical protein
MSDVQLAADAAGQASGARRQADRTLRLLVQHLMRDHAFSIYRIAKDLGMSRTEVRTADVEFTTDEEGFTHTWLTCVMCHTLWELT